MCGRGWVGVDVFEISTITSPRLLVSIIKQGSKVGGHVFLRGRNIQSIIRPLHLLDNIQTRVNDELVHVLRCLRKTEPSYSIPAGFGGAKREAEQGDVGGGEDGEVV
jgi:hypothetical protein